MAPKFQTVHRPDIDEYRKRASEPNARFRKDSSQHWTKGRFHRLDHTGAVEIADKDSKIRTRPQEEVELATKGPRGGVVWKPFTSELAEALVLEGVNS